MAALASEGAGACASTHHLWAGLAVTDKRMRCINDTHFVLKHANAFNSSDKVVLLERLVHAYVQNAHNTTAVVRPEL